MSVPVLTAVSGAVWEADLVAALSRGDLGVTVVRRCVDLADLLATAATGQARAALLSSDLRRLDRDALVRLQTAGVAVVGLVPPGDEEAERHLRRLGVRAVLPSDTGADGVAAAVLDEVLRAASLPPPSGWAEPRSALPDLDAAPGAPARPDPTRAPQQHDQAPAEGAVPASPPADGSVVAVWGPTGAPGRTTVATGLASEVAALGRSALLVDADVYGGVVAQVLGLLDEAPGLATACRLANQGLLDLPGLLGQTRRVGPGLSVLTGTARADRWPELRPAALEVVLSLARLAASWTVVDCGFGLEQDEELAYDTLAPRRNGATLAVLEQADVVLVVGTADPVGLQRLVRGLVELKEAVPGLTPRVVVNRLRPGAVPGDAEAEVRAALSRYAGVEDLHVLPHDLAPLDLAVARGRTLVEAAPQAPLRLALQRLAADLVGVRSTARARRRLLRR